MNEFFAAEAERYLDQLDALLAGEAVDPEQLFHLSRGVHGSAHMAGSDTVARVAERLENVAVAVLQRHVVWGEEIRGLAQQTVGDLRVLVRALNRWGPAEEQRVRDAVHRWDDVPRAVAPERVGAASDEAGAAETAPGALGEAEPLAEALHVFRRASTSSPGEQALRNALALRPLLEEMMQRGGPVDEELRELVDELFGLVRAGLRSASRGASSA